MSAFTASTARLAALHTKAFGLSPRRLRSTLRFARASSQGLHVAVNEKKSLPVVIETKNVPVLLYAPREEVEPDAVQQLIHVAESALPTGFVSAMPDVHLGKGVTIGTVFASENYICPNAVGVDIGCGMCAVPVDGLHKDDMSHEQLVKIQQLLKRRIPTGFNAHKKPLSSAKMTLDEISHETAPSRWLEEAADQPKPAQQLGTLGGGNHFMEVLHDESGKVWLMLHSGSRNIGNITAQNYDKIAQDQLAQQKIRVPGGLNYLAIDSQEGQGYLQDMAWCQGYAFQNRKHMLDLMVDSVNEVTGANPNLKDSVNIHHNYCQCERCEYTDPRSGEKVDKELWVTRKGATSAQKGQYGIIPGSMGVGSFITKGKGDPQAWNSCSHGAGRAMSRTKAKATITQASCCALRLPQFLPVFSLLRLTLCSAAQNAVALLLLTLLLSLFLVLLVLLLPILLFAFCRYLLLCIGHCCASMLQFLLVLCCHLVICIRRCRAQLLGLLHWSSARQFTESMVGIVCDTDFGVIDEAPMAYKDLTKVMANQEDLVDVVHRLLPIINVKGFDDKPRSFKKKSNNKKRK